MSLKEYATFKIRRDTAGNWSSNNPTPLEGEWCLETDTGNVKIGDGSTTWTSLEYRQRLPFTYTLTSNKTHTLPPLTGFPQTESVYWTGGGTYKLTIKTNDGTPLDYNGEGKGHILVESDGSNWQVREYEDSGGNTALGWIKQLNGKLEQWKELILTSPGTDSGYIKETWTFGLSFTAIPRIYLTTQIGDHSSNFVHNKDRVATIAKSTTSITLGIYVEQFQLAYYGAKAEGQWK